MTNICVIAMDYDSVNIFILNTIYSVNNFSGDRTVRYEEAHGFLIEASPKIEPCQTQRLG